MSYQLNITRIRWHLYAMLIMPILVCYALIFGLNGLDIPEWAIWTCIAFGLAFMALAIIYAVRVYFQVPVELSFEDGKLLISPRRRRIVMLRKRSIALSDIRDVYLNNDMMSDSYYVVIKTGKFSFWFIGLKTKSISELESFYEDIRERVAGPAEN